MFMVARTQAGRSYGDQFATRAEADEFFDGCTKSKHLSSATLLEDGVTLRKWHQGEPAAVTPRPPAEAYNRVVVKAYSETLTDGSKVWNVMVTRTLRSAGAIHLAAVTERDAMQLAHEIANAIAAHTNEHVEQEY